MLDNSHAEAQAFYRKAMALEGLGRPEAAVVVWRQAAKVAPNDLMVRKKLVNAVFWPELGVVFGWEWGPFLRFLRKGWKDGFKQVL